MDAFNQSVSQSLLSAVCVCWECFQCSGGPFIHLCLPLLCQLLQVKVSQRGDLSVSSGAFSHFPTVLHICVTFQIPWNMSHFFSESPVSISFSIFVCKVLVSVFAPVIIISGSCLGKRLLLILLDPGFRGNSVSYQMCRESGKVRPCEWGLWGPPDTSHRYSCLGMGIFMAPQTCTALPRGFEAAGFQTVGIVRLLIFSW